MPPVTVYGKAPLADDDRIGTYAQPRWTADRLFPNTRVYVIPEKTVQFEYWFRPTLRKDGKPTKFQSLYELEFGLPHRFQLDLYAVGDKTGPEGAYAIDGQKVELRYALADWGKLWGNPTLYFEWGQKSGKSDTAEVKLLLGGGIASGWHWGSNLVWEQVTGGTRETERAWTVGISHTVRERKASVGIETHLAFVNELDASHQRTDIETAFFVGPSFQFRPLPQVHLDIAPLFGVNDAADRTKLFVVFGWEF